MSKNNKISKTWNKAIEKVVEDLGNKAMGYKWMHSQSAYQLELTHSRLSYINICISPLVALGILTPSSDFIQIKIAAGSLTIISGIVSGLLKFWNNIEKAQSHRYSTAKYSALVSNIRKQLSLAYEDRQDGSKYIEWLANEYDHLISVSPLVEHNCIKKYLKLAMEKKIPVPDLYGLSAIQIIDKQDQIPYKITNSYSLEKKNQFENVVSLHINNENVDKNNIKEEEEKSSSEKLIDMGERFTELDIDKKGHNKYFIDIERNIDDNIKYELDRLNFNEDN